jgi:hypothetical protein
LTLAVSGIGAEVVSLFVWGADVVAPDDVPEAGELLPVLVGDVVLGGSVAGGVPQAPSSETAPRATAAA